MEQGIKKTLMQLLFKLTNPNSDSNNLNHVQLPKFRAGYSEKVESQIMWSCGDKSATKRLPTPLSGGLKCHQLIYHSLPGLQILLWLVNAVLWHGSWFLDTTNWAPDVLTEIHKAWEEMRWICEESKFWSIRVKTSPRQNQPESKRPIVKLVASEKINSLCHCFLFSSF